MAENFKDFDDCKSLFCKRIYEPSAIKEEDRIHWQCELEYWEQGLFAKIKDTFYFNVKQMNMGDVVKGQALDVEGRVSITFRNIVRPLSIVKTECKLTGFKSAEKEGERNVGTTLTCTKHTSMKLT